LDGKTITRFDGSKVTLHLVGKSVRVSDPTLRQRILSFLINPNLVVVLFPLALLALWAEFNHPGAVVPGVVGFICLLLALYVLNLLPYRGISLVMMLAAFILFALEAKYQTHGAIATAGVALLIFGMLLLVDGPIPEMRVKIWTALAVAIPLGLITVFLMSVALRARRNKVVTGEQGLVGEVGTVVSALTPAGKVLLRGALWNAVAAFNVEADQQVVVRSVENLVLHVEPISQTATLSPARP
jgi:membrane-bound serine protease (ClpP class)